MSAGQQASPVIQRVTCCVEDDEMTLIVAHSAHAWLEALLFAPAAVVVAVAIVRGRRHPRKETPNDA